LIIVEFIYNESSELLSGCFLLHLKGVLLTSSSACVLSFQQTCWKNDENLVGFLFFENGRQFLVFIKNFRTWRTSGSWSLFRKIEGVSL